MWPGEEALQIDRMRVARYDHGVCDCLCVFILFVICDLSIAGRSKQISIEAKRNQNEGSFSQKFRWPKDILFIFICSVGAHLT